MTIDEMLAKPGYYEAANPPMRARGLCVLVEVTQAGVAHQLTPDGRRDGVLSREGWAPGTEAKPLTVVHMGRMS